MKKAIFSILFLIFFISNFQVFAQSENITSIKIVSSWGGLGTPSKDTLKITRKKNNFYSKGKRIESDLISNLMKEIESDKEFDLADFGITPDWLNLNADKAIQLRLKNSTRSAKEYFASNFRNYEKIREIFPKVLGGFWTDDFPKFEMIVSKTDGSTIRIYSDAQGIFMIPWIIEKDENKFYSTNPKLSRAISVLLPKKFTNKQRINGDYLLNRIAEKLNLSIDKEIDILETNDKIGEEILLLREKGYEIKKTAINHISSIDVGTPTSAYQTKEYKKWNFPSWNAELKRIDLPENVIIGVSIPFKNEKLTTFDIFTVKIDGIINQTLSVPWLNEYIKQNPDMEFEIRFVESKSLSNKARESFFEDLDKFGSESLSEEIKKQIDESVFLQISEKHPSKWSRWLVLADGRMILWQINGNSVLKWKPSDFETKNMYDTNYWFQAKAIISPNGTIESR